MTGSGPQDASAAAGSPASGPPGAAGDPAWPDSALRAAGLDPPAEWLAGVRSVAVELRALADRLRQAPVRDCEPAAVFDLAAALAEPEDGSGR